MLSKHLIQIVDFIINFTLFQLSDLRAKIRRTLFNEDIPFYQERLT